MKVLITGAAGFIGNALCWRLASDNKVIGVYHRKEPGKLDSTVWERAYLTDGDSVGTICEKHSPDVVIHCAGIAHQKIGAVDQATYLRVNSELTENLARVAAQSNPAVHFVFLSTISVYGERNLAIPVTEDSVYRPTSDYAVSKLDAEKRLISLLGNDTLKRLTILRLAPVYDRYWSLNLDRRVFAPKKLAYLRFGRGEQRLTALARPNLVEFVSYLVNQHKEISRDGSRLHIFNVCDVQAYSFQRIIKVFRESGGYPGRPMISVPLFPVWLLTRAMGMLFKDNRAWWHACYEKVAIDLVFDNSRMLSTGFSPRHSLETVFLNAPEK